MLPSEFRRYGHEVVDWIAGFLEHPERYPVLSQMKPGALIDALPAAGPEQGEAMSEILADFEKFIVPGMTHWNHPGFMAYFANSSPGPAILAEMLAAALNGNGMAWKASPAITELELVTLAWLREWMALPPDWFGMIHDTASTSSMHAAAAARELADPEARIRGGSQHLTVYTSQQSHASIAKGAISIGMGADNVRQIPVDSEFRMRPDALEEAILRDEAASKRPCMVGATIGTTSTTSVDPVPAIADLCEREGIWLHVDAAYAGSAMVCPEFRWAFAGVEHADSLVVNAHKWMLTPVDCSLLWCRRPEALREAFSMIPEYLRTPDAEDALSLSEYGPALGRRFRALKLWAVVRCHGRTGLQQHIRHGVELAARFEQWVAAEPGWELTAPRPFSVVCFRLEGDDEPNRELLERVNASGEIFISHAVVGDRYTLRLAVGQMNTTEDDIRIAWDALRREAARLG